MTKVIDGGMMIPIAPAVDISAAEEALSYPTRVIAGIMIMPSAATVAGPDPEIAAKKQETMTQTIAMPLFL